MHVPAHAMSIAESGILNDRDLTRSGFYPNGYYLRDGGSSFTCIARKGNPLLG